MSGSVLRQLVDKSGKTQKEIAADLGFSQQRFNYYVSGRSEPDASTLLLIADYFHVTVDYLLGRDNPEPKPLNLGLFAAYGSPDEYTPDQLQAIDTFMKLIRGQNKGKDDNT